MRRKPAPFRRGARPTSVSVFGLGKLGATMVGCFAARGFRVTGVDVVPARVRSVSRGIPPVEEPGLAALYRRYRSRIRATGDAREAVLASDVSFIIVPTPSRPGGAFSSAVSEAVARQIGNALRSKAGYHLVVLTSTVLPGTVATRMIPALERASGRRCGRDFGVCYSPEFIAIGDVIRGLLKPDFFLIGEHDARAGRLLAAVYRRQGGARARIARMGLENAELTKIAVNTYVTAKIAFANTLARLCDRLPGGNARTVARAVGLDRRIGSRCLMPGPAFGGPCFPRDNRAFAWMARRLGIVAPSAAATDSSNRAHTAHLLERIRHAADRRMPVLFLGLSYKPRTGMLEESCAVHLAEGLLRAGFQVRIHDPLAPPAEIRRLLPGARVTTGLPVALRNVGTVVYATDHEAFARLSLTEIRRRAPHAVVVDLWGRWADRRAPGGIRRVVPGIADPLSLRQQTSRRRSP